MRNQDDLFITSIGFQESRNYYGREFTDIAVLETCRMLGILATSGSVTP